LGLIVLSPIFVAYMAKFLSNQNAKGIVLKYYFGNMHVKCLENMSKKFIKSPNLPKLRAKALEAILWHQKKAHDIIILSASLEIYLIPWSKMLGIDKVAGTKLRLRNNIITGHIDGRNCYGEEKVVRLKNLYGNLNEYELYGYGDTVGDRAFLNICDHSFYKKWPDR